MRMFENTVLGRIYEPKRQVKQHNWCLHHVYPSLETTVMIKSRRIRWAGHVSRFKEMSNAYRIVYENLREQTTREIEE
jgi:hypothetical protein